MEHPIDPRGLGAPMHIHENEDEFSYVLEGEVGFQVGDDVIVARPGDLAPGWLRELLRGAEPLMAGGPPDVEGIVALQERYGVRMDPESIGRLAAEHGLVMPGPPPSQ